MYHDVSIVARIALVKKKLPLIGLINQRAKLNYIKLTYPCYLDPS